MATLLRALLLTDVVDSTRLTEQLGDAAMAALWTAHDRVARDLLPLWRGREIDKTDGMLLLFESVADAVGYALAYHRALAAQQLPLKARAGIHVGHVTLRPNPPDDIARGAKPVEVDGLALPIAARVMSIALGAQTLLSADARLALGVVPQRVVSHGHWRMHGVADPLELFEIGDMGDGGAPFTAPPDGAKVYRVMRQGDLWQPLREVKHSVPAERDSFVGRQEPLQLLAEKLEGGARLVSVLGIGGTGKTRLVTRFAWTCLGDHPGGVWFCDLSQARSVDGIFFAVAQGLDVPLGKTDPVVQLAHAIAGRGRCLVILDNFEQVARLAEETLGRWLDKAPLAQFVVTTREVLGLNGEQTLPLDPLEAADAAQLFLRRVEAAKPGYRPSEDDLRAIEHLVEVLDGLPLAIELAAARSRVMTPRVLLTRMHERFSVLLSSGGRHDRQSTLRAAFDWSWELLSEPERAALAQLSVFAGGFTLAAAEAVIDLSQWDKVPRAVDIVDWLVSKSFVRSLNGDRFTLLQSVRDYAASHLASPLAFAESGPSAERAAEQRHGTFFATQRQHFVSALEVDNLVAACRRATLRQDGTVAVATFEIAWEALKLCGPFRVALDLADDVRATSGVGASARARIDQIAGKAQTMSGRPADARVLFERARSTAASLGDAANEARSLAGIAELDLQEGRIAMARDNYEAALQQARSIGDGQLECAVLNGLGTTFEQLEEFELSQSRYEEALLIARRIRDRRWEGGTIGNLGFFYANRGDADRALQLYDESLEIADALNDRQWRSNMLCNAGLLNHAQGNSERALAQLEAALGMARELGYSFLESVVLCNLGMVDEARGYATAALERYEQARAIASDRGYRRLVGQVNGYLGLLRVRQGEVTEGRTILADGAAILRAANDRVSLGILLCSMAQAMFLSGDREAGLAALAEASDLATTTNSGARSELGLALRDARAVFAHSTSGSLHAGA